ncbi:hypothetical protein HanRHA438_Chr10g0475511 [Helianthus annuus]|uniref:Uncharacterized protein n=1 Tax=Helianthus annuus TaxID=4232 RepID=A0A9K3N686_HELAN|nr:hypothetical protein HanXRQr2_Chr10g0463021 [Helianthus annuus]KAJ0531591.1 hypothetical protein HanHA89_Chr10g0402711 [Helianthus annuus]KAJ0698426.1 hypothetical protein HanLR1_Chr10g0379871 [Helianthus annuus]KAJ0701776.1 hypothetical protein HanOQP8_Chr10g0383091 [Helianthus annuus]KAJ0881553.1 hypothetical protein HanRHA438_Chr10g0475511 [Helianthus annuus]
MDMEEDTDPVEPQRGMPTHPIKISDGSSFHGSPYNGPDSFAERWATHVWEYTPSYHSQQQQQQHDPSEDSRFVAVTPPPPPPIVQQPPPEPPRRKISGARMTVREGEFHFSTLQHSIGSHYPPLHEDPQMGGPSNPVSEMNSAPIAPPSLGFGNPIPTYAGSAAYNPFEQPTHTNYNYAEVDPYQAAWNYNAIHPEGPYGGPWTTGYPPYAYQYPIPPQPPMQPQPLRFSPPEREEILQRIRQVEHEVREERRHNHGFFKGLANLIKGKSKRDH